MAEMEYCHVICLDELRKTMKCLSLVSWWPDRSLTLPPPGYKSSTLTLDQSAPRVSLHMCLYYWYSDEYERVTNF
jgi:hypothetical protein